MAQTIAAPLGKWLLLGDTEREGESIEWVNGEQTETYSDSPKEENVYSN